MDGSLVGRRCSQPPSGPVLPPSLSAPQPTARETRSGSFGPSFVRTWGALPVTAPRTRVSPAHSRGGSKQDPQTRVSARRVSRPSVPMCLLSVCHPETDGREEGLFVSSDAACISVHFRHLPVSFPAGLFPPREQQSGSLVPERWLPDSAALSWELLPRFTRRRGARYPGP